MGFYQKGTGQGFNPFSGSSSICYTTTRLIHASVFQRMPNKVSWSWFAFLSVRILKNRGFSPFKLSKIVLFAVSSGDSVSFFLFRLSRTFLLFLFRHLIHLPCCFCSFSCFVISVKSFFEIKKPRFFWRGSLYLTCLWVSRYKSILPSTFVNNGALERRI